MADPVPPALLRYRRPLVVGTHLAVWTAAWFTAFLVRFDLSIPEQYLDLKYVGWLGPLLIMRLLAYRRFGLFQGMWRYTGHRDLFDLLRATLLSSFGFALLVLFARLTPFPRSVLLIESMLTVAGVGGLRFASRSFFEATTRVKTEQDRHMLIVGAGNAGEAVAREILRHLAGSVRPVGFVDDDPNKRGTQIHGIPVLGGIAAAARLIEKHEVTEVVIATPQATGKQMRRILEVVRVPGVQVRTIPGMGQLVNGQVTVNQLRDVAIEDLLGRDPVTLDTALISDMLRNEVVLITGAGGSIGSELCRQICAFRPRGLVLVEQAENSLYQIHREIKGRFPEIDLHPRIADICDRDRLDAVFAEFEPGIVLHAAAHKHVPMMEWNPTEAVKNNVGGTRNVADLAHHYRARRFLMVSTDKAVNPTSVMGCTKRIAELYVQAMAQKSETRFLTTRFGNVLGSNGSVIPLFREQITNGGPVTVTHPDMERFFMTIPEASQLVLQATAMAASGEVCILDMGEPVKIVTLAEDLIRLSGLEPGVDIEIKFVGTRPGEKLFEELSADAENAGRTAHPKIFTGRGQCREYERIATEIDAILQTIEGKGAAEVRWALRAIVPEYKSPDDSNAPTPAGQVLPMVR